jgi:hypothetical protein
MKSDMAGSAAALGAFAFWAKLSAAAPAQARDRRAQKLAQLQPFVAVFPPERTGQLASSGPT